MCAEEDAVFIVDAAVGQWDVVCRYLGTCRFSAIDGWREGNTADVNVFFLGLGV